MADSWVRLKDGSLAARTQDVLTAYVLSDEVRPGDWLPSEQQLCERLGVSRSTLREAVTQLEVKGLLSRRHGVGMQVVDRSSEAAAASLELLLRRRGAADHELLEMRRLYEVQAATWAAERASDAERGEIEAALSAMGRAGGDLEAFAAADLRFHLAVAAASGNAVLAVMVQTIRTALAEAILANLRIQFRPEATLAYHRRVYEAVASSNRAAAAQAMAEHLDDTAAMLQRAGQGVPS